ncbi:hypothetical protein [Nocardioides sp. ChNu-99]|uniref:hypothetical protein n=1 Tax=Nocardioides sp. ChNu-99 TaxID=2839897 RepID=UPI002406E1F6|nr:hypothetical protein [Nocardioides sp. ChNu-99]MDF9716111.1 hypothetical protein [Nocardioides sp. ChNu-99]
MSDYEPDEALHISPSARGQLPSLVLVLALLGLCVVLGVTGAVEPWLAATGSAVVGAVILVGLWGMWRTRGPSWELRLARDGVTVRDETNVPWSDVLEVRITGFRPRWIFLVSPYRVVSFVGRPGVELPMLPSTRWRASGTGNRGLLTALRQRWYGTQLLVMPYAVDASAATIADAEQRFSDVPVRRG